MIIRIFALLFVARTCMAVTVNIDGVEIDCSQNCMCCKGGMNKCYADNRCSDGCVDTIYGHRCHDPCHATCFTCEQNNGRQCYSCKATYYGIANLCTQRCSVGCDSGTCDDDGNCSCTANFVGNKCDTCKAGYTGPSCTECSTGYYGVDCKKCPSGCRNGNCMNDGTCFQCVDNSYGLYCNLTCSVGCNGGNCNQDGSCTCKEHFTDTRCETCNKGKYGNDCQQTCSVGCVTSTCDRNNGLCGACLPLFVGNSCEQCNEGSYGQSCDLHCSDYCTGQKCARDDGACTYGCTDGYSGRNCTIVCDSRCATCDRSDKSICISCFQEYTGYSCSCPPNCQCSKNSDKCILCNNMWKSPYHQCKCHAKYCHVNGCNECLNKTFFVDSVSACCECPPNCKGGLCLTGPQCTDGCEDGFYGMGCDLTCTTLNVKCFKCSQISGNCLKCINGFYLHANGSCIICNSNCMNRQCSSDTGTCVLGCTGTFWGDMCDSQCDSSCETCQQWSGICDACSDNTFRGSYCNHSCSSSCFESKCEQSSGHCSLGCQGDFFGNMCQFNCPENCQQSGTKTTCNANGKCAFGCVDCYEGDYCTKRQMDMGSPTNIALAVLSGVLGILLIFTAAGCYLWNRRLSKSTEQNPGIQLNQNETERTYEQLQRQANEPTYRNVDENYSVLSM